MLGNRACSAGMGLWLQRGPTRGEVTNWAGCQRRREEASSWAGPRPSELDLTAWAERGGEEMGWREAKAWRVVGPREMRRRGLVGLDE
jgi:hypothetical protein